MYLSEDASGPNGLFYRWTAPHGTHLRLGLASRLTDDAGTLEAMQIRLDDGSILPAVTAGKLRPPDWSAVCHAVMTAGMGIALLAMM